MILKKILDSWGSVLAMVLEIQCPRCPPQYTEHMVHLDSLRICDNVLARVKTCCIKCCSSLRTPNLFDEYFDMRYAYVS